jgi:hypothetical protein
VKPPSTSIAVPVIHSDSSLGRNSAALAISSGSPARRIGCGGFDGPPLQRFCTPSPPSEFCLKMVFGLILEKHCYEQSKTEYLRKGCP